MNVTFDQAYWYTNDCPLRQLAKPVIPEEENALHTRGIVHDTLIDVFDDNAELDPGSLFDSLKMPKPKRGLSAKLIAENINQVFINYAIWKTKHRDSLLINKSLNKTIKNMTFDVDIARFKSEGDFIQLTWFRYDYLLPKRDDFSKLIQLAHWNARGFQLYKDLKPMQLTYYFPVIGTEFSFLYNTENKYDIIASLISKNELHIKPSDQCDICDKCPMTWVGYYDK